jgi:hypothetical protein
MQQALRDLTFRGYRVETADGTRAIISTGEPVNHILHLLLPVFTCGRPGSGQLPDAGLRHENE